MWGVPGEDAGGRGQKCGSFEGLQKLEHRRRGAGEEDSVSPIQGPQVSSFFFWEPTVCVCDKNNTHAVPHPSSCIEGNSLAAAFLGQCWGAKPGPVCVTQGHYA